MAQQYSLAHLTVLGCAPPEMTYIAARAGYDFVSLRCIYMGLPGEANYELASNKEMLRQTQRALKATGVRLHDIELARIKDNVDPKSYLPALEVAAQLGARAVLSSIWTDDRGYAIDKFGELCDLARQFNLTVDLEAVPIAGIRNTTDAADVLRAVGRDGRYPPFPPRPRSARNARRAAARVVPLCPSLRCATEDSHGPRGNDPDHAGRAALSG